MNRACQWCGCNLSWWRRAWATHCRRCAYSDGGCPCRPGAETGRSERDVWNRVGGRR